MIDVSHCPRTLRVALATALALMLALFALSAAAGPPTSTIQLPNGRWLEYAVYGDDSGPLVLYFHGTPGSHLEPQAAWREIDAVGIQLIAIDRPGIGRSTYQCDRRITGWPADVSCLLESLGRGGATFGVVGFSGGTPYALACARAMPERITRVAIVSGHAPTGAPGVTPGEEDHLIEIFGRRTRLANVAVSMIDRRLRRNPDKVVARVTKRWNSSDRQLVLCNSELRRLLEASLRQTLLCGSRGIVKDVQLLGECWGFPVHEAAAVPISIWHGGKDRIAPLSMGRYFHESLSGSVLHVDPCAGHVAMFKWHAVEILGEFHGSLPSIESPR